MSRQLRLLLVIMTVLCSRQLCTSEPPKEEVPKPLPKDIVAAWEKTGAEAAWCQAGRHGFLSFHSAKAPAQAGWLPAFRFPDWKEGMLKCSPEPECAFAVDLEGTKVTDAALKELIQLKQLTSLDLSGTQVTDAGLKELTNLKQLISLYLNYTKVTDA